MLSQQFLYAKVAFEAQFAALHDNSFQEFFQKLMQYRYPTFLPVRPYGPMGDRGSDGLCSYQDKLYACYGPQSPNDSETSRKFKADLASAIKNRSEEFSVFVFVHNDRLGMHPKIASEIVAAKGKNPRINFEQMGKVAIWREFMRLDLDEAEDMLGQPIRVELLVYGISLVDLEPLLSHLARTRDLEHWSDAHPIPRNKLEFNRLSADTKDYLIYAMRFTKQVDEYYNRSYDVLARDETAAAFREKYQTLKSQDLSPDEILQELFVYVAGNHWSGPTRLTSVFTILSYFFQTCDIFEEPPVDFSYTMGGGT